MRTKVVNYGNTVRAARRGAATVEFAVVAPIVFLVVLGLIQFAGLLMSRNALTAAAREGGRVASMPSTISSTTVENAVKDRLQRAGINPSLATVTVTPTTLSGAAKGQELKVTVSAAIRDLSWIWAIAPPSASLTAEVTYTRE